MPRKKELSIEETDAVSISPDVTESTVLDAETANAPVEDQVEQFSLTEADDVDDSTRKERKKFYALKFNELDRYLTVEERQEWNSIYASYRGRSSLSGMIVGNDVYSGRFWNREARKNEVETKLCAVVIPYRVPILIPADELWMTDMDRPDYVLQGMAGAKIDFIITRVEREDGYAVASRRLASRAKRYYFSQRPALHRENARIKCKVLAVGPRRCLVDCYGHDIDLTQRELRYTAIPNLKTEYHPGKELDCIVKSYKPEQEELVISVKETETNPFDGANIRHPVGSRRMATIAGKYGGGVFCNLPDGTVCMCNYSYQHTDAEFMMGDTVILVVQNFDMEKKQMYGKIISRW
jgi:ribosomal protein S1